jgi:hypothetical protein
MKKIQNLFWVLLPFVLIGYIIYKIAINSFTDHFLGSNPQHIKAIIINERNFKGNHSSSFAYSYHFEANGKEYTGNSHDESAKIGDTVEIVYNKDYPSINKSLHPKE